MYPADKFEQYVRRLGIDRGDQLVVYARGPMGGMLHAARAWFLFRVGFLIPKLPGNPRTFFRSTDTTM